MICTFSVSPMPSLRSSPTAGVSRVHVAAMSFMFPKAKTIAMPPSARLVLLVFGAVHVPVHLFD